MYNVPETVDKDLTDMEWTVSLHSWTSVCQMAANAKVLIGSTHGWVLLPTSDEAMFK